MALETDLKAQARLLGFDVAGIAPAELPAHYGRQFEQWLARGRHGEMAYMARAPQRRADPQVVLPGARSVISLGMNYYQRDHGPAPSDAAGKIARYAWGRDYHSLIEERLDRLAGWLRAQRPEAQIKSYVDHGPVLERAVAQEAGLGFIGKNTMLITDGFGSWVFLAELLTTLALQPDAPQTSQCGSCRLCIDACPTGAIVAPYELDATRCISYLTIEVKRELADSERKAVGDWFFGCDVCQEVCPYNQPPTAAAEPAWREGAGPWADLERMTDLSDEAMASLAGTPLTRPKKNGLMRNAAAVAGNRRLLT